MPRYETTAGHVTRADTYAQILEKLRELQELYYLMGHLHTLQDNPRDLHLGQGWRGMGEMTRLVQHQVTELAKGGFTQ